MSSLALAEKSELSVLQKDAWRRVSLWAEINRGFSPYRIDQTKRLFADYLGEVGRDAASFVGFVGRQTGPDGWLPTLTDEELWWNGVAHFAPGTFEIVDAVVFSNLEGRYRTYDGRVLVPQGNRPLPMTFERVFGEHESTTVQPTRLGIKVILKSTPEGYAHSGAAAGASEWSRHTLT